VTIPIRKITIPIGKETKLNGIVTIPIRKITIPIGKETKP